MDQIFLSFVKSFNSMKQELQQQAEKEVENVVIQDPASYIRRQASIASVNNSFQSCVENIEEMRVTAKSRVTDLKHTVIEEIDEDLMSSLYT